MNRRNYNDKTIGIFDTIGSYFVDVFYNSHYLFARESVKSGRVSNITDGYRANVLSYMNGLTQRDDLFKKVVQQLHEFYQKNSGFGSVILSDFQDRVLSQFIPPEYYRDFAERDKDRTLREIIIRTVNEFGEITVSRDILPCIIDDHMNRKNVSILQDHIVDIFIMQREDYYSKFARVISKQNAGNTVEKETVKKLKNAYVDEKKKGCQLADERDRAIHMIKQLMEKIYQLDDENKRLLDENKQLLSKIQLQQPTTQLPQLTHTMQPEYPKLQTSQPPINDIDEDDGLDDDEIHRRQQEAIEKRILCQNTPPKTEDIDLGSLLDDDPWGAP